MSKILVEGTTYPASITVPVGADARTAASIEPAFQNLTDRTRNLKNRIDAASGVKTKLIPLAICRAPDGHDASPGVNMLSVAFGTANVWAFSANSNRLIIPLDVGLNTGDVITNVSLCVYQGNAGASGQMSAKAYRQAVAASAYATVLQLGSTLTFVAGAGFKNENLAIAANNTVDANLYQYHVELTGSALAATLSDFLHWVKVTYTAYGSP